MLLIILQNAANTNAGELSSTIGFLTAMITPALLISASGTLVLTTSTRLGRVIDRVRELEKRLNELVMTEGENSMPLYNQRIEAVFDLLDKVTTRSRMLQKALFVFYCSLVMFVLTSLTIAVVGLLNHYAWIPIPVGLIGMLFVFYGSIMMMQESRLATATTNTEMNIIWRIATSIAPKEIVEKYSFNAHGKHRLRSRIHETLSGNRKEKS